MKSCGRHSGLSNFFQLLTVQLILLGDTVDKGLAAKSTLSTAPPDAVHLKVASSCDSTASLVWTTQGASDNQRSQKCELTYFRARKASAEILDISLDSHAHIIRLFNLSQGENYTAFIVCGELVKTNEVNFIPGKQCEEKTTATNHSFVRLDSKEHIVPVYSHANGFDTVQWPIAVIFTTVGMVICAVVAFYTWKKYQRRQRILRIFRQGQHDPFQALYSPTQDSYSF